MVIVMSTVALPRTKTRLTRASSRTCSIRSRTASGSTSFHHIPSRLSELATITASACRKIPTMLSRVTPLPTSTGSPVEDANVASSSGSALSPVRWPVTMMPSESKNSASRAISGKDRSATMAWAPCLTWTSVKIRTSRAPIHERYRVASPARPSMKPSFAT